MLVKLWLDDIFSVNVETLDSAISGLQIDIPEELLNRERAAKEEYYKTQDELYHYYQQARKKK